jgi:hypothetical protein
MSVIFDKTYDGETIADVQRDLIESFDPRFNPKAKDIPVDEYGFQKGRFKITVEWINPNQEEK